jgi:hypothetical protein
VCTASDANLIAIPHFVEDLSDTPEIFQYPILQGFSLPAPFLPSRFVRAREISVFRMRIESRFRFCVRRCRHDGASACFVVVTVGPVALSNFGAAEASGM